MLGANLELHDEKESNQPVDPVRNKPVGRPNFLYRLSSLWLEASDEYPEVVRSLGEAEVPLRRAIRELVNEQRDAKAEGG